MTTATVIALATLKVAAWVIPAALAAWLFVGACLLDHEKTDANPAKGDAKGGEE